MPTENKPNFENYAIAILKPDSYRDYLDQMILADFEKEGLSVVFRKEMKLDEGMAQRVYFEHNASKLYPFMVESLLLKDKTGDQLPCMLIVLKSEESGSDNALTKTQQVKGRADKNGIRAKYRMYYWHELEKMGYTGDELSMKLAQNRLHVPDDYQRTAEILGVLLTKNDTERLAETAPDFAHWLKGHLEIQEKA